MKNNGTENSCVTTVLETSSTKEENASAIPWTEPGTVAIYCKEMLLLILQELLQKMYSLTWTAANCAETNPTTLKPLIVYLVKLVSG
jgi:hypothetical protein